MKKLFAFILSFLVLFVVVGSSSAAEAETFGYTAIAGSRNMNDANVMDGSSFVAPENGTITSMSLFVVNVDPAPRNQFQVAIYADNLGQPGTLIVQSATGTLNAANSWNTIAISAVVTANTKYWFMYNTNGKNGRTNVLKYDPGNIGQTAYRARPFGTWPTIFGPSTKEDIKYSLYVTYIPIGSS